MRRAPAWLTAGLALLLPASSGAAAPPGPDARAADARDGRAIAVLDAARAASGGRRWARVHTIRYLAQVASGPQSGSAETLEDTRTGRYVDRYLLGQVRGGQGFDGQRPWRRARRGHRSK